MLMQSVKQAGNSRRKALLSTKSVIISAKKANTSISWLVLTVLPRWSKVVAGSVLLLWLLSVITKAV